MRLGILESKLDDGSSVLHKLDNTTIVNIKKIFSDRRVSLLVMKPKKGRDKVYAEM